MQTQQELYIRIALDSWNIQIGRTNKLLESLADEKLQQEVSPNRNSGVYLLGHLTAIQDGMLPLLNFGHRLYPQLEDIFIKNPDKSLLSKPSVSLVRRYWKDVNSVLASHFIKLKPEEWLKKHTAISDEDFAKEPHRNRLSVLLNRTNHLSYHFGQLAFLAE